MYFQTRTCTVYIHIYYNSSIPLGLLALSSLAHLVEDSRLVTMADGLHVADLGWDGSAISPLSIR